MFIWYFRARKLLILVSSVSGYCCCLSVFDFIRQIIIRTAQQWLIIGACFRLRTDIANLISFVGKIRKKVHLTNETSYWLKKPLMRLIWAIYNLSDLNIDPHICFFPDLVTGSGSANPVSTARGLSAAQREACMRSLTTQKPKRLPRVIWQVEDASSPPSPTMGNMPGTTSSYHDVIIFVFHVRDSKEMLNVPWTLKIVSFPKFVMQFN